MELKRNRKKLLFWLLVIAIFVCSIFGFFVIQYGTKQQTVGYRVVKLMYEFDSLEQLSERQVLLKDLLTEEEWERLNIDNEDRAIEAYFKFGAEPSKVQVVYEKEGIIVYKLLNENIDKDKLWFFYYEVRGGKVCNIREYYLSEQSDVGGGAF